MKIFVRTIVVTHSVNASNSEFFYLKIKPCSFSHYLFFKIIWDILCFLLSVKILEIVYQFL